MLVLFGLIIYIAVGIFWGGYAAATLWGWFVVPLGVKAITYWHAVGLGTLVSLFVGQSSSEESKDEGESDGIWKGILRVVVVPAVCLAFGWVAHSNM